jgi:uracil-DNA glycosylase
MHSFSEADIPQDWRELLGDYFESREWVALKDNLQALLIQEPQMIGPKPEFFFKALRLTTVDQVKVVILGQDPYHSPGLAQGLAFSIPADIAMNSRAFPSSLRNISKALAIEQFGRLPHGDLHHWAKQGVLLLNTALSVKLGEAGSHANLGWKSLIDQLISALAQQKPHLVWLLWGGHAQSKLPLIANTSEQLILQSSHPSGLGVYKTDRPFLEPGDQKSSGHFIKTNEWLVKHSQTPIQWISHSTKDLFSDSGEDTSH